MDTQSNSPQAPEHQTADGPITARPRALPVRMVADLMPSGRKFRVHSEAQVAQIVVSIQEFGFTNPVLIDEHNMIIAGEGRLLAAKKLKLSTVPCIVLAGLTAAQKAAYAIADNKLVLNASWDADALQAEFDRLSEQLYDLNLTGFSEVEIAALLEDADTAVEQLTSEMDDAPQPEAGRLEAQGSGVRHDAPNAWQGMPEFKQPDAGPFRTIHVHFKDEAAVDAFAKLIDRKLTDKTKWVWYPEGAEVATTVVYG